MRRRAAGTHVHRSPSRARARAAPVRKAAAVAALAVVVVLVGCLLAALAPAAGAAPRGGAEPPRPDRVLILSVPVLGWEDVNTHRMPNLNRLLDRSAIANLATRTVTSTLDLADGYVTLGAGTRAVGAGSTVDGQAFGAHEVVGDAGGATGAELFARRTGRAVDHGLVHLGIGAIERRNESELYDARIGSLGDALARAGHPAEVIANADGDDGDPTPTDFYRRPAVAALMDTAGPVPAGVLDERLLTADAGAPYGLRLDVDAMAAALADTWKPGSVALVEASDLVREDLYRDFASTAERPRMFRRVLRWTDELVGAVLREVDFRRDTVMVVGPAHGRHDAHLTLMGLRGPGVEAGLRRSGTTHRAGFVELVDVAPTILDQLGIDRPEDMEGRAATVGETGGSAADRRATLQDSDAAARFREDQIAPVSVVMVVVTGCLAAAMVLLLVRPGLSRAQPALYLAALAFLGLVPAVFVARLFPFYTFGAIPYYVFLFGMAIALAAVLETRRHRHPLDPLIGALSVIVVVLVLDTVLGAPLQFNSALGYSPKVAGRFTGLGNIGYAALTAATVVLAALLANRVGGRRGARVAVGLLAFVFVIDATPLWGADVGGILSVLPAFAVMAYLLLGLQIRLRTVVVWLGVTVLTVVGFGLLDLARPSDQRTHLGRLFERIGSDGWSGLQTVIERKAEANLSTIGNSVWLWVLPMVGAFVVFLVLRQRPRVDELIRRIPELRAAAVGFAVLAVLGYALNDSGVAVPGMMVSIVNAALVCLLVWVLRDPRPTEPRDFAREPETEAREPVGSLR